MSPRHYHRDDYMDYNTLSRLLEERRRGDGHMVKRTRHGHGNDCLVNSEVDFENEDNLDENTPINHSLSRNGLWKRSYYANHYDESDLIGALDRPIARGKEFGIHSPEILCNNFKFNQGLMNLVKEARFSGKQGQDPLDHLELFERLCNLYNFEGLSQNAKRMMMFPFSLTGAASIWESETPSKLMRNWEEVKDEFLDAFFSREKTLKIRSFINNFKQGKKENFFQSWRRFKGYLHACPHHGFDQRTLLGNFYIGSHEKFRNMMDASSGGSFSEMSCDEGELIVTRLAKNWRGSHYGPEEDSGETELEEMEPLGSSPKSDCSRKSAESGETEAKFVMTREVNLLDEEGKVAPSQKDAEAQQQAESAYHQAYAQRMEKIKVTLSQLMNIQSTGDEYTARRIEGIKVRMNAMLDEIESLKNSIAYDIEILSRSNAQIISSSEFAQAVTLRSGRKLPERSQRDIHFEKESRQEKRIETPENQFPDEPILIPDDKTQMPEEPTNERLRTRTEEELGKVTPIPFPGRVRKRFAKEQRDKFDRLIEKVEVVIPLTDLMEASPSYKKFMKDLVSRKRLYGTESIETSHECSAIIQGDVGMLLPRNSTETLHDDSKVGSKSGKELQRPLKRKIMRVNPSYESPKPFPRRIKEETKVIRLNEEEICDLRWLSSSNGETREVEMLDEVKVCSNGKTRESVALRRNAVPSIAKTRASTGNRKTGMISSRVMEPSPRIVPSLSSIKNKEKIIGKVQAKIASAIQIMKNSGESKFLLENDPEFKNQYEALLIMKARVKKTNSKKKKYDRRTRRQKKNCRRRKKSLKELDKARTSNYRSRVRAKHDNVYTREDMVNKLDNVGRRKTPNETGKDPGKSLRPSHKLKEKVNSKYSTAWKVKNRKSNRVRLKWDKSGGEPTSKKKRFNVGLDPPVVPTP